jgi:molybdopterin/thiamine biosynthesis adenylyltransferase
MYRLNNSFVSYSFTVTVVGCGGTGAFVAEGLSRFLPLYARLVLVDHDRVEERNLSRQNFFRSDVGKFKSEAIAERLARLFQRPVGYAVSTIGLSQICYPGLIIGCVDNGQARQDIARRLSDHSSLTWVGGYSAAVPRELQRGPQQVTQLWWVDAGNGENYGQILVGNAKVNELDKVFDIEEDICRALPFPTIQRPELLTQVPPVLDCAQIAEQEPTINRVMAGLVIEVVRKLIEGTCPWMQLWLDLEMGTLTPVLATPQNVAGITQKSVRKLVGMKRGGEQWQ